MTMPYEYDPLGHPSQESGRPVDNGEVRTFSSGATRDTAQDKLVPWAFGSSRVDHAYAEYMHRNRKRSDGSLRNGDDWKQGIPPEVYHESLSRHILDYRLIVDGAGDKARTTDIIEALLAIKFNVDGLLHELLTPRR